MKKKNEMVGKRWRKKIEKEGTHLMVKLRVL